VAWRKLAEICGEWLKKGKKVYIEGRIQTRSYDDKNTGAKKYMTEIVADSMIMLDGKSAGAPQESSAAPAAQEPAPGGASNDDLPF
jgi:single-strand DNA-binding protein